MHMEKATPEYRVLHSVGYLGFFIHHYLGGRFGKPHILIWLLQQGGKLTQRELHATCSSRAATLSETLSKLETAGLITRRPLESDRRQQLIELTDLGFTEAKHCEEQKNEFEKNSLAALDDKEKEQLAQLLDTVVHSWHALEDREAKRS